MRQIDVVGAVIQNEAGEVLCARRAQDAAQGGLWEFPGGKTEPGERPEESLRREIREELGCDIAVGEPVATAVYQYPAVTVRLMTYRARLVAGQPTPREHAELRWLPVADLGRLSWSPADLATVARLQAEAGGESPGRSSSPSS
ncbi:MAG: (deoxy)nucleoside triphosphate pyrophosphohydrolase [Symbiobacterium sp.]|uniref:(deoxy)nucleoside triphosphate pyrophosphohydrolase n=1 Tax=Symbiobacterium sp. TaxID=1971213 RepID=UPI003463E8C0